MRKIGKKMLAIGMAAVLGTLFFAGCSKNTNAGKNNENGEGVRKIVIATAGTGPEPYVYSDNGNIVGYDIDVINAIFEKLPQYETEIVVTEFASIFTGIDADLYDVGLNHLAFTVERGEKYLYTDVYSADSNLIAVRKDDNSINSIKDIVGKNTYITASSNYETKFLNYNEKHSDAQVGVIYTENTNNALLDLVDGKIDFYLFTAPTVRSQAKSLGLEDELKFISVTNEEYNEFFGDGEAVVYGNFYIVAKDDEELASAMNGAFEELVEEGKIFELEQKWLGIEKEDDLMTIDYVNEQKGLIEEKLSE